MDQSHMPQIREDRLITGLYGIIRYCIKFLAILMVGVIIACIVDVVYILYDNIFLNHPIGFFHVDGILSILGAFIAVLITIEVFNNIVIYLHKETLHVKLVLSTALIAVARKVIILDYVTIAAEHIYAIAAMVVATALAYWIVSRKDTANHIDNNKID